MFYNFIKTSLRVFLSTRDIHLLIFLGCRLGLPPSLLFLTMSGLNRVLTPFIRM